MTWKVLPPLLTALGSLILAFRVKSILDVLILAQLGAEANFRGITEYLSKRQTDLGIVVGLNEHVARQQRRGMWLLVVGFGLIGAAGLLNAYLAWGT